MRRVVSLFLPTWATDRLRRRNGGLPPPEVPLITAIQQGNQRLVAAVDDAARRLKLRPGMTIAHAQSLVPNLTIHDAMPGEDEAALSRLALWCTRYSPLVTPDPPNGVFIDIAGSAHLFKGEAALLQDLIHVIDEHLIDETELLNSVGGQNEAFTLPAGRGDEARRPSSPDPRGAVPVKKVRDIYIPDLHIDTLAMKARNFG